MGTQTITAPDKEQVAKITEKPRLYYAKVAIVGPTGSGKSYMTKNLDRKTTGFINVENKPLPYKAPPFLHEGKPKTWAGFRKCLGDYVEDPTIEKIVIDSQTMAFAILNFDMQAKYSNWDIPKNYNKSVYEYFTFLKDIQKDVIVLSHDELVKIGEAGKQRRIVVHNKEYEGKCEENFTICLYTGARLKNGKPDYFLKTFEEDSSTKTPEGLFPDKDGINKLEIPNDAAFIFKSVEEYYS